LDRLLLAANLKGQNIGLKVALLSDGSGLAVVHLFLDFARLIVLRSVNWSKAMREIDEDERRETIDQRRANYRGCKCGNPDWPGQCPGWRNCPVHSENSNEDECTVAILHEEPRDAK
jgi:hypothetical protein